MAKHGLDIDIHSSKYGWMLRAKDHILKGGIHSDGWSDDWARWIKNHDDKGTKITKDMIEKQLDKMVDTYELAKKGFRSKYCYSQAQQAYKAAERMARKQAAKVASDAASKIGRHAGSKSGPGGIRGRVRGGIIGNIIGFGIALAAGHAFGSEDPWGDACDSLDPFDPAEMGNAEITQEMRDQMHIEAYSRYQHELNQDEWMLLDPLRVRPDTLQGAGRTYNRIQTTPSSVPSHSKFE